MSREKTIDNKKMIAYTTEAAWLSPHIEKAVVKAGGKAVSLNEVGVYLSQVKHDLITKSTAIVVDLSNCSSDSLTIIGIAQALDKPIIALVASFSDLPNHLRSLRCLNFGSFASEDQFVNELGGVLVNVVKDPSKYSNEGLAEEQNKKHTIFISYSHNDKKFLDRLLVHLRPLQNEGLLELWADTHLRAGDKWRDQIEEALDRATAAVLILSADFLASDFVINNELPPLLKSAEEKGTRIIPLIAKPCRFTRDDNLKHFQSINDPKEALLLLDEGNQERIYDALCAQVEKHVRR